jgi:hypothetical protein
MRVCHPRGVSLAAASICDQTRALSALLYALRVAVGKGDKSYIVVSVRKGKIGRSSYLTSRPTLRRSLLASLRVAAREATVTTAGVVCW